MRSTSHLNMLGLLLNLVGVILLFYFGMPFHVPTEGVSFIIDSTRDQATIDLEHRYKIIGYVGFSALLVGSFLQMAASYFDR